MLDINITVVYDTHMSTYPITADVANQIMTATNVDMVNTIIISHSRPNSSNDQDSDVFFDFTNNDLTRLHNQLNQCFDFNKMANL